MSYIASISVCIGLILLISFSVFFVISVNKNRRITRIKRIILFGLCVIIVLTNVMIYGKYIWPFERQLNLELHAVLTVQGDQILDYPGQAFWHSAYEQFGLYAGSFHFNTENPVDFYNWPPMCFEHNSFIISYGQRIVSLSYNVWDTIDDPIRTGAYAGYAIMDDAFVPNEVYIYRIRKIRIDNGNPGRQSIPLSKNDFSTSTFQLVILSLVTIILIVIFSSMFILKKIRDDDSWGQVDGLRES